MIYSIEYLHEKNLVIVQIELPFGRVSKSFTLETTLDYALSKIRHLQDLFDFATTPPATEVIQ